MNKIINKIRDELDTEVSMIIICNNEEELGVICEAIIHSDKSRIKIDMYEDLGIYMYELRLPYNRYLEFMKQLHLMGWNLKAKSKVDIINELVKNF